jgi:VWFA-related protein
MRLIVTLLAAATLLAAQETISLVALDRQNEPVTDLKASEIQLRDNDQPMTIASFGRLGNASESPLVILYDLLNTVPGARGTVSQQIADALRRAGSETPVSLYLLSANATLVAVRDSSMLDAAMRNTSVIRPKHLDPTGARVKATYDAIAELYKVIATQRGRKSIVWITHGVPLTAMSTAGEPIDYLPVLKKFACDLGQEQVVINPVQQSLRVPTGTDSSRDSLQYFANFTGGRFYPNETIERAITESLRDTAASYVLAYDAPSDGKFHSIRITCTRPGVRIQSRSGYFADSR